MYVIDFVHTTILFMQHGTISSYPYGHMLSSVHNGVVAISFIYVQFFMYVLCFIVDV